METKPIKRSKELMQLSRDHHEGLLLCWKIRTGLKNDTELNRIEEYVLYFFEHHLKEHFRQEEEILFPVLEEKHPMKIEVLAQHNDIYAMIEEMKKTNKDAERLKKFADHLDDHIRFEERKLFPYIESNTYAEQLEATGKKLEIAHQQQLPLIWTDEFWLKNK
ncbi:MAG TPA: hemerythrin domain-containing protein [Flavipsychrobacter sp.]|nr:hemerythrin domain-containing protein [Flavipsychrobacter sp.]